MDSKKTTLFRELYKSWKQIIKNRSLANNERIAIIKIQSSIAATKNDVYDLIEKQKSILCDIEKFDHIEFLKITDQLTKKKQDLDSLNDIMKKLFSIEEDISIEWDVWWTIEEEIKSSNGYKKEEKHNISVEWNK